MSLQTKLKRVAVAAAQEAAMRERGRCLWILDDMITKTTDGLASKVMIEKERHFAQVKLDIMGALASRMKKMIVAGKAPSDPDFEDDYMECCECFDRGSMYHEGLRLCEDCYAVKRLAL